MGLYAKVRRLRAEIEAAEGDLGRLSPPAGAPGRRAPLGAVPPNLAGALERIEEEQRRIRTALESPLPGAATLTGP